MVGTAIGAGKETMIRGGSISKISFQLVNRAYENVTLVVTSNLDFSNWGTLNGLTALAGLWYDAV